MHSATRGDLGQLILHFRQQHVLCTAHPVLVFSAAAADAFTAFQMILSSPEPALIFFIAD